MKNTFCATPFLNLVARPNGDINPCCLLEHYVLGNIKNSSMSEIFHSDKAQELRSEFLNNNIKTCKANISARKCNEWDNHLLPIVSFNPKHPLKIDLRLNGKCNFECIMCEVWKKENGTFNEDNFWSKAREDIFPFIKEIKLLGGEPFIQSDTFKLIDEVYKVNPDCKWSIWTNGGWNPNKKIEGYLMKINIRSITLSLDSVNKETFEKIRLNSNFDQVLKCLNFLTLLRNKKSSPFFLQADLCLQRDNWREVEDYLIFCLDKKIYPSFFFLFNPRELSLTEAPVYEIKNALRLFLYCFKKYENQKILQIVLPLIKLIPIDDRIEFLEDLVNLAKLSPTSPESEFASF